MAKRRRKRRRRRGRRRNPGVRRNARGIAKSLTGNVKELMSMKTLKEGAWIAVGSLTAPIAAGVITGAINKARPGTISATGYLGKAIDLLGGAAIATGVNYFLKKPRVASLLMLGAVAGTMSDITNEKILPLLKLRDYFTPSQLVTAGMADYAKVDQVPMSDYASTAGIAAAGPSSSRGEY